MRFLLALLAIASLIRCSSDSKNIPAAVGMPGDIYLVMDSAQHKGPVGKIVDSIFRAEMPGLPRPEAIFKMRWIDPRKLGTLLKLNRNFIYVMTLDQKGTGAKIIRRSFTQESLAKILTAPEEYSKIVPDVFARGQQVMYLFSKDEATLIKNLRADAPRLVSFFDLKERERMTQSLFKAGQVKGISELMQKEFQCDLKIPFGYKLADKQTDFLWVRQINPRDDKDIFISFKPYTSQNDFRKDKLIAFRDAIAKKYLYGDPEIPDSYLVTEMKPYVPVTADTINFKGHFAMQLRGLFRSNDYMLGGPFLGFAFVDESTQRFYYIEGFTISPGKDQREIMRELETILYTFRTSAEIQKN